MKNDLPKIPTQSCNFDFTNPVIAVSAILTIGICYCVTINTITKRGQTINLKYKDFSLLTSFPISNVPAVSA